MTKQERLEKQKEMLVEMSGRENELHAAGYKYIAGIDEVGRGPLAGPVYTAAVVLPENFDVLGINDSKKLSAKKREELSAIIKEQAIAYGIGIASAEEIDEMNILNATKAAMLRAIDNCNDKLSKVGEKIDHLLVDAVKLDTEIPQESIIKGDANCLCIAAASIVAKVARDSYMIEMDAQYPGYDFASNKGYGTASHYEGLREFGFTPIHRKSFLKNFDEKHSGGNMAKKVYAVKSGREIGIFTDWDTCKKQVDGFPGAEYKSFTDANEALVYLGLAKEQVDDYKGCKAYVDGSFDTSTTKFSCGVVVLNGDETFEYNEAFEDAEAAIHRNVAGEVMGSTRAIEYALKNDIKEIRIYHDYEGIAKWANDEWKANHTLTQNYKSFVAEARKSIKIDFVKVKAHTGNKYNELADKLAKKALGML